MAEFTPRVVKRTSIGFHPTVLPAVYDDALSYYEELNKILHMLNDAIDVIDENRALILQLDVNVKELDARLTAQIKQVANDLTDIRKEYEGFRDEVQAKLSQIDAKDADQDRRLSAIETKNTQQDNRLTAIESKNTQQDNEINALKARASTLENNLSALTSRVSALETNLTALTKRITAAEGNITNLRSDITRIDQEQTVQNNRIKALEDSGGGGGMGSVYGVVEAYQLRLADTADGQLNSSHFIRHVDNAGNKYNILLNTGNCVSALPVADLFAHNSFVTEGQPEIDELIITSWDPNICAADAITQLKSEYTIKHAWIPSSINWANYTGTDKSTVQAVESAVIAALHEGTNTEFTRMGDAGQTIDVGAIEFNCLYDPTAYGKTSANMLCRINCLSDMIVPGNYSLATAAKNNEAIARWLPNAMVIDAPINLVPNNEVSDVAQRYRNHLGYLDRDMDDDEPAGRSGAYGGVQWYNVTGVCPPSGCASMISLSGYMPRLYPTSLTKFVPVLA